MALALIADGVDLTEQADELVWSNVDPGGYELCSFTLPVIFQLPAAGALVTIWEGLELSWMGYVEEIGDDAGDERAPGAVSAVGPGVLLKDGDVSVVLIDRALSSWQAMSRQRRGNLGIAWDPATSPSVERDSTDPALKLEIGPSIPGSSGGICEAWYDAGQDNTVKHLHLTSTERGNLSGTTWIFATYLCDDAAAGGQTALMADQNDASVAFRRDTAGTARRWALIQHAYAATSAAANNQFWRMVKHIAVIGDHGIPLIQVGAGQDGFDPAEIARWVFDQVDGIAEGTIENSDFVLLHSVYRDPVTHEQILNDMVGLLGWHWGVWGPDTRDSLAAMTPTGHFRPPPEQPTAMVAREECRGLRVTRRVSTAYNQARVRYTDAAGQSGTVLVELANPAMPEGRNRVLPLDAGTTSAAIASEYGLAALALEAQQQARAAGPCELPETVAAIDDSRKPAHLLKSGIDRLRVTGLEWQGPFTDDTRSYDTFRIRRLESRRTGGKVATTAELDAGANLLEVLAARLAVAAAVSA